MGTFIQNLHASLHKGFIDHRHSKSARYAPKLLVNNPNNNDNVLSTLLEELETAKRFIFSVAFITESGLATLKSHLFDLKQRGIKGRILTSTFLNFNQPKVFKEMMKLQNVEIRVANLDGFHAKGYVFEHDTYYSLIVGSSNLTAHALKVNYEWNVKLTSHENGEIVHKFKQQFEEVWHSAQPLTEAWVESYERTYTQVVDSRVMDRVVELPNRYQADFNDDGSEITPNRMQDTALIEIETLRRNGYQKALVISATGTGKTYLSAFDVRNFAPKRMLFIVHREQILNKAKSDFKRVLGGSERDFGILSGSNKQKDSRYLFATIQTISKDENLSRFNPTEFDYILIDEVHKAGAKSYRKLIDYFRPKFLMGMTATPERTDDFNIYGLFDYNIAYEIRLQEALEEDMLCPFHYFGVTDLELNGESIDDATILSKLVTEERVDHLIEKIEYYGYSGDMVRGLIFCSRKEEAEKLSLALNEKGFRTIALTGEHPQEEREYQVRRLEDGLLDYILTVDIFNEGIDIPSINQVVMLRQTQSSIIFIQQLGRGLRKHHSKDFVTIIDFIGNYKNNYLIPIALAGDKSQNKDNIRRLVKETGYIKGVSTVNFEEIAKKKIFKAIDNSNLTALKVLREAYLELKNRIGRVPCLHDFVLNHSIDPVVLVDATSNYNQFLLKMNEEVPRLTENEGKVLTMLSLEVLNGKRMHEILLVDALLRQERVEYTDYLSYLIKADCQTDEATIKSVQQVFDLSFFTQAYMKKYGEQPIITLNEDNQYTFNEWIRSSLESNRHFRSLMIDVIETAKECNKVYLANQPLTLHKKYSRKDACKLLNWYRDESSTMYGYKTKYNTCPIFVTYHKNDEVESSVDYGDEFLNQEVFKWYTRSNRTLASEEVKVIIDSEQNGIELHLFVKKDNDEGSDFYYLGKVTPDKSSVKQAEMLDKNGKLIPVVHMNLILEQAVDRKLYSYITNGTIE